MDSFHIPDWKFEDARIPTDAERQRLSRLMYVAFCDLRALALDGRAQQAKDLAEAFHNIPLLMHTDNFSFKAFRDFLERYQQKYEGQTRFNYLQEWEKLGASAQ
ncbi:MAG: hypothetical protein QOE73_2421 [Verrucomicrobiota bacterium]|jgi:hypothetical protein